MCGFDGDGDELSSLSQPQDPAGLSSIEITVGQLTQPGKVRRPEFPIEVCVGYTVLWKSFPTPVRSAHLLILYLQHCFLDKKKKERELGVPLEPQSFLTMFKI